MKNKTINKYIVIGLFIIIIINLMIIIKPLKIYKYELLTDTSNDYQELLAVRIEQSDGSYASSTDIPTSGYTLNETESFCGTSNGDGTYTHNTSVTMSYHDGVMNFDNLSKRKTKCFIYFDIDNAAPTINTFYIGGSSNPTYITSTSTTIYLTYSDTDVAYYCISTTKSSSSCSWVATSSSPISVSYTLSGTGTQTLYAFLKDKSGNISSSKSDSVTVDTTAPTISTFYIGGSSNPAYITSTSTTVYITYSDSDVAYYCISTTDSSSSCSWKSTSSSPISASYTLSGTGTQTLYAFLKDKAGNISSSKSDSVTVDTTAPTVDAFYIGGSSNPSTITSTSTTVYLTYSDSDVAYFCISTSDSSSGCAWSSTSSSPVSVNYTLSGPGTKTLYAFLKDSAGNISSSKSDSITVSGALKDVILGDNIINSSRSGGSFTSSYTADTAGTIFSGTDDYGTTYFFAGANPNNWVKFAGFYWRIIRINGDGSIRLIYNGTDTTTTGTTTQISTSAFNSSKDDNAYVGYMYGSTGASTYSATHTNTNSSTIKGVLDSWYSSNLSSYASYIDTNAGFCGDRGLNTGSETWWSSDTKKGYGTNATAYAPYGRLLLSASWRSTQTATYKCSQTNDLYTVSSSSYGNKALTYPIGLITSDEVVYAGGFGGTSNSSYWLYTNQYYWTISPDYFIPLICSNSVCGGYPKIFQLSGGGSLSSDYSTVEKAVRPVINLKSSTLISSGSGTSASPYIVS